MANELGQQQQPLEKQPITLQQVGLSKGETSILQLRRQPRHLLGQDAHLPPNTSHQRRALYFISSLILSVGEEYLKEQVWVVGVGVGAGHR
jgi:hypothetical protein